MPTKIEIAKLLINAKADLNKQDFEGKSALHWAVERHNVDVVKSFFSK
jgi:ankyrin repeat protein